MVYFVIYIILALSYNSADVLLCAKVETSKANSYLIEKWELWYTSNDVNHDGILSLDDLELYENFFESLDNLSEEQLLTFKTTIHRVWKTILLNNRTEISKDDFVAATKLRYEANKTAFIDMVDNFVSDWSKVIDLNGDKFISQEEFLIDVLATGHNDITKDEGLFSAYQPVNGLVPLKQAIRKFVSFLTEDDKTKPENIKNALYSVNIAETDW